MAASGGRKLVLFARVVKEKINHVKLPWVWDRCAEAFGSTANQKGYIHSVRHLTFVLLGGPGSVRRAMVGVHAGQAGLVVMACVASGICEQWPRGGLSTNGARLVAARRSNIANAGRGLFAVDRIPANVVLGNYPGRLLSPAQFQRKLSTAPTFYEYCWMLSDDRGVLDPTDETGKLMDPLPVLEKLPALLRARAVSTKLALMNEPPVGTDVCVDVEEEGERVTFVTARDIEAGEELYLDYGPGYDRSAYG
jgi:hypothetical protein